MSDNARKAVEIRGITYSGDERKVFATPARLKFEGDSPAVVVDGSQFLLTLSEGVAGLDRLDGSEGAETVAVYCWDDCLLRSSIVVKNGRLLGTTAADGDDCDGFLIERVPGEETTIRLKESGGAGVELTIRDLPGSPGDALDDEDENGWTPYARIKVPEREPMKFTNFELDDRGVITVREAVYDPNNGPFVDLSGGDRWLDVDFLGDHGPQTVREIDAAHRLVGLVSPVEIRGEVKVEGGLRLIAKAGGASLSLVHTRGQTGAASWHDEDGGRYLASIADAGCAASIEPTAAADRALGEI